MPRPCRLTADVQARIVEAVRAGLTWESAARAAGIAPSTLRDWRRRGEAGEAPFRSLVAELDAAEAAGELALLGVLHEAAARDWRAAAWLLERRWPGRWGRRSAVELSGEDGGPVRVTATEVFAEALQRAAERFRPELDAGADCQGPSGPV